MVNLNPSTEIFQFIIHHVHSLRLRLEVHKGMEWNVFKGNEWKIMELSNLD